MIAKFMFMSLFSFILLFAGATVAGDTAKNAFDRIERKADRLNRKAKNLGETVADAPETGTFETGQEMSSQKKNKNRNDSGFDQVQKAADKSPETTFEY